MKSNILELQNEFGHICPNQFAGDDEEFQHHAIEEMLPASQADKAAQEIADQLGRAVKVDYQIQFWTGEGHEAPHRSQVFYPTNWPTTLTVESVAAWLWSHSTMPVNGHAILRAFKGGC